MTQESRNRIQRIQAINEQSYIDTIRVLRNKIIRLEEENYKLILENIKFRSNNEKA